MKEKVKVGYEGRWYLLLYFSEDVASRVVRKCSGVLSILRYRN